MNVVIDLTTLWLHDVTLTWCCAVSQRIVTSLDGVLHVLLVFWSGILKTDKSLGWWGMLLLSIVMIVLIHYFIEAFSVSVLSVVHHFMKKLIKLLLDCLCFWLEVSILELVIINSCCSLLNFSELLESIFLLNNWHSNYSFNFLSWDWLLLNCWFYFNLGFHSLLLYWLLYLSLLWNIDIHIWLDLSCR